MSATALSNRLQLLDRKETASLLRVTVRTLQRMEQRGELKPRRVGKGVRYLQADLASMIGN